MWEGLLSEGYLRLRFGGGGALFSGGLIFIYLFIYFFVGSGGLIIGILRYIFLWGGNTKYIYGNTEINCCCCCCMRPQSMRSRTEQKRNREADLVSDLRDGKKINGGLQITLVPRATVARGLVSIYVLMEEFLLQVENTKWLHSIFDIFTSSDASKRILAHND